MLLYIGMIWLTGTQEIKQGPWASTESRLFRRDLQYLIDTTDIIGELFVPSDVNAGSERLPN